MAGVPRADVDDELPRLRAEVGEGFEQPFGAAWLEGALQLEIERIPVRPEFSVELLDRSLRVHRAKRGSNSSTRRKCVALSPD